jgi:hypothetical protein
MITIGTMAIIRTVRSQSTAVEQVAQKRLVWQRRVPYHGGLRGGFQFEVDFKSPTKALSQAASPDECACCRGTKSLPYKRLAPGERRLRAPLVVIVFVAAVGAAQAQSLRVAGTAGYVSEWELSGETAQIDAGPIKEFAGPLTLKHVGLCSRDGPQEETGEIKFQIMESGSLAKIKATLLYLGTRCTYTAKLSNSISNGFMQCSDVNGIPLTLIVSNR